MGKESSSGSSNAFQEKVQKLVPVVIGLAAVGILVGTLAVSCNTSQQAREANEPVEQSAESFNLATAGQTYADADKANVAGSELLGELTDAEREKLYNAVYSAFGDEQVTVVGVPSKDDSDRYVIKLEDEADKQWWATFQTTKVTIFEAETEPSVSADVKDKNGKANTNMRKGVSFETMRAVSLDNSTELAKVLPEKVATTLCDKVAQWADSKGIPMSKSSSLADVEGAVSKGNKVTIALLLVRENDSNRVTCVYDASANRITLSLD